jgi:hypothetical protein
MSGPLRRTATNLVAWLVGAAVSVTVGVLALSRVDDGLADGVQPLSPDSVTRALPGPPSSSPTAAVRPVPPSTPGARRTRRPPTVVPHRSPPVRTASPPVERSFVTQGGSMVVRCTSGRVYLASWSPAPGYRVSDVQRGPGDPPAGLTLLSEHRRVRVELRCVGGVPQATVSIGRRSDHDGDGDGDDDDHFR